MAPRQYISKPTLDNIESIPLKKDAHLSRCYANSANKTRLSPSASSFSPAASLTIFNVVRHHDPMKNLCKTTFPPHWVPSYKLCQEGPTTGQGSFYISEHIYRPHENRKISRCYTVSKDHFVWYPPPVPSHLSHALQTPPGVVCRMPPIDTLITRLSTSCHAIF